MIRKKSKIDGLVAILLLVTTLLAAFLKIFIGLDSDESYIISIAFRLQAGAIPFKNLWDAYISSAIIPAILLKVYTILFHTISGSLVFLRFSTLIVLSILSIYSYIVFKRYYSKRAAFLASLVIANMLPRATYNFEYGLETIVFGLLSMLILLDIWKGQKEGYLRVLLSAVFYSASVFVYPTMIITTPILFYIILFRLSHNKKRNIISSFVFWTTCFILFSVFVIFLLSNMSIDQLLIAIHSILKEEKHTHMFSFLFSPSSVLKSMFRCICLLGLSVIVFILIGKRICGKPIFICYVYMGLTAILVIGLNISGLRPCGPFGLLERFIIFGTLSFTLEKVMPDEALYWTFIIMGTVYYIGSLCASALSLNENAMYLEMSVVAGTILAVEVSYQETDTFVGHMMICMVLLFVFSIIFSKGYFVRIERTEPANIFEKRFVTQSGFAKGIFRYQHDIINEQNKAAYILKSSTPDISYMCITNEPVLNFYYNGFLNEPTSLPESQLGKRWVDFYEKTDNSLPDMIYIDRDKYNNITDFYKTDFGSFVSPPVYGEYVTNDNFIILKKNTEVQ